MFDNEGHWIDDPPEVVSTKPDFSGLGLVRHLTDEQKPFIEPLINGKL